MMIRGVADRRSGEKGRKGRERIATLSAMIDELSQAVTADAVVNSAAVKLCSGRVVGGGGGSTQSSSPARGPPGRLPLCTSSALVVSSFSVVRQVWQAALPEGCPECLQLSTDCSALVSSVLP